MLSPATPTRIYRFGNFAMALPQQTLTLDGEGVKLGGRASGLLAVLVEAEGRLVPRETLLEAVWPGQAIDDSALRVHLSAARKVLIAGGLAEPAILNEAGRGYRLAADVTLNRAPDPAPAEPTLRLPTRIGRIVGRDHVTSAISRELLDRRFITITGPGGIGKTTAAIAIAHDSAERLGTTACFVDLAPLGTDTTVLETIALSLGVAGSAASLRQSVVARLAAQPSLMILDNCEHVIDAVAPLAEELLHAVPDLQVLATSREPLRAEGEWVHRLAALDVPAEGIVPEEAASFSAVDLFLQRARAAGSSFECNPATLGVVVEICRRLDGIPLAIELAAARMDAMDPEMILFGLDDRFALLSRGRRTAMPRHRTLRAALDWSYALLDDQARRILDRLAPYRAGFDIETVLAVAENLDLRAAEARDVLADLVAKSLVVSLPMGSTTRYRLLDTTRDYGLMQLREQGLETAARREHARHLLKRLSDSAQAWEGKAPREWLATYSGWIDDVRSALTWAQGTLGDSGDSAMAVELLIAGASLWFHLSLPREFLRHAENALATMEAGDVSEELQIELLCAYGHSLWHTRGPVEAMGHAFERAQALAESTASEALVLRAGWGIWAHRILAGAYVESLSLADDFARRVGSEGALFNRLTAAHMQALSHHFSGNGAEAARYLNEVLAGDAAPERATHANHAQVDGKIAAMSLLMRLRWTAGALDEALALARACREDIDDVDHALSACYGLAIGCIPVAIAAGEKALAGAWIDALARHAGRSGLDHWAAFVPGYGAAIGRTVASPHGGSRMQEEMFAIASGHPGGVPWAPAMLAKTL